jgi:hypothetical protein
MGLQGLFRRRTTTPAAAAHVSRGAPFVLTLEGALYADASERVTDVDLAGGAPDVLGAGRIVVAEGRVLQITNESPTYRPSLAQMRTLIEHLAAMGLDLSADGRGALVIVFSEIDASGLGKNGARYRVARSASGVDLVPE